MRFLCLHGRGTSSKVSELSREDSPSVNERNILQLFQMQTGNMICVSLETPIADSLTAALRFELGDEHTYIFLEGTVPCQMAPGKFMSIYRVKQAPHTS
jgi:hypothetical protein